VTHVSWLECQGADIPAGDGWLAPDERAVQATLTVPKRRADWRLGRWTAKQAVTTWLEAQSGGGCGWERLSILAADDGAPEAWCDGQRLVLQLSISHRAGRGVCAVGPEDVVPGCDLELVEPRSDAFIREWLAPAEQGLVEAASPADRPLLANLVWSAKEAAAKVRRAGLRLDVRRLAVEASAEEAGAGWRRVVVGGEEGRFEGWWRTDGEFVLVVVSAPPCAPPRALAAD